MEKWIIIEEEHEEGGVPQEREIHRDDDIILRSGIRSLAYKRVPAEENV